MSVALTSRENDCRSCYKCIRNCPVKSIAFHNGQASIIPDECVLCGKCFLVCPSSCKVIRNDLSVAKSLIDSGAKTIVSLAPSFLSAFPGASFKTIESALLKLGFAMVEETAVGATIVKKEYDRLVDSSSQDVIISTCCHSINLLIEKHYPDLSKCLAPVLSPMLAHALDLKKRYPGAKVVFIGPCISKKNEIEMYPDYDDCVLTFLEMEEWLKEKGIEVAKDDNPEHVEKSLARLFPTEGGILATMKKDNPNYVYLSIAGMEDAKKALEDIAKGNVHHAFIEMSSCEGSCINGPAINPSSRSLVSAFLATYRNAGKEDFETGKMDYEELKKRFPSFASKKEKPSEEAILGVLAKIGKTSKKDELNCSSCGYASCRDKAIAVLEGKASLEMCLPFLMEKAKSFSNSIVEGSDNAILVCNEDFSIQLANPSMANLVGASRSSDLVGKDVSSFLDPDLFGLALGGENIKNKRLFLSKYDKYVNASVSYNPQFHMITAVYIDITKEEEIRQKNQEMTKKAAEITTKVIDKNMRAVQEIASLLGESTAETKVALTQLKDALSLEEGENKGK